MSDRRTELHDAFRQQERFAVGYSPLYAQLFALAAGWLAAGKTPGDWLVAAAAGRPAFDVTLLLPSALHREVLAGAPGAAPLTRFYPTVGGRIPDVGRPDDVRQLALAVEDTVVARGPALAEFIGRANVQTNETARGLSWLLPVTALGWPAVHLIELGASAGLNLVAERRGYRLAAADDPATTLWAAGAAVPQFTTLFHGRQPALPMPPASGPTVLSRLGGDLCPFLLDTADDELTLSSFVWADQPQRLDRLCEGIAALRAVAATDAPVRLRQLRLPEELPGFLAQYAPQSPAAPLVVFNTTVTMYLPDAGRDLRRHLAAWAERQDMPVLWLQWEPAGDDGPQPPVFSWLAWSADLWQREHHRRLHLGWVHPHGAAARDLDLTGLLAE